MFAGLSNQVTSWMGAVKGEPQDEEVPTPTMQQQQQQQQQQTTNIESEEQQQQLQQQQQSFEDTHISSEGDEGIKAQSPTKTGGMFSNVKSQMTGWLGNASIPAMPSMPAMPAMPAMPSMSSIPGLRKTTTTIATDEGIANDGLVTTPDNKIGSASGIDTGIDDEDRSRYISATEGADSRPASGPGTPTDEKAGAAGNVTTKVTQGAKTFGSFLYSAVNKAGAKIKETVKDNSILGEFSKEQEAFIKSQQGNTDAGVSPWIGHSNEEKVKEEILSLSADRRNFVRAPPAGVDFDFNYDISYPVAISIMNEDTALEKMRFELVPKIITEEHFWRNYFYRVSLICQAEDLGTLGHDSGDAKENLTTNETISKSIDDNTQKSYNVNKDRSVNEMEFISDTFHTTDQDLEEVQAGMKKLGIDSLVQQTIKSEEQWEKDLEAELQDFEVVSDGGNKNQSSTTTTTTTNNDWEKDVDDLLGDTDDLK